MYWGIRPRATPGDHKYGRDVGIKRCNFYDKLLRLGMFWANLWV